MDFYTGTEDIVDDWNLTGLVESMERAFVPAGEIEYTRDMFDYLTRERIKLDYTEIAERRYAEREEEIGAETMRELERLKVIEKNMQMQKSKQVL